MPSRWAVKAMFWVHAVVIVVVMAVGVPNRVMLGLIAATLCHGILVLFQWRQSSGPFSVMALHCSADFEWDLCCLHGDPERVELVSYQPTMIGLVLSWRVLNGGAKAKRRWIRHTVFKDQLEEADYRWLKVLLARAVRRSDDRGAVKASQSGR
ncbi:MAG: hypothetical protein P8176_03555 [Gammaproteobacteria bacterium]